MSKILIIVIVIILIFVFTGGDPINAAKGIRAKADVWQINKAIGKLAKDTGEWPGHQEPEEVCSSSVKCSNNEICESDCGCSLYDNCAGILGDDKSNPYNLWNGPYMLEMPLDPWGREYFFDTDYVLDEGEPNEKTVVVVGSYGADGAGNNQYNADDIVYIMAQ